MRLERRDGRTVLTAPIRDQSELHGVIEQIQELGFELISVNPRSDMPDTIVLIHGFWVTPRSWEHWAEHYEARGYKVIAPAYPGLEVEVEALNEDPSPLEALTVPAIIEHLEEVVGGVESPPILIGHSAGGVFTQILLDHGFGAAGVAINSAPTEGVKRVPLSQVKATFPVLKNPANRHRAVGFTHEQWHYAFTNGFSEEESRALYERYHIPASGSIFWGSALANIHPGKDDNWVNYDNDDRAPLLFISGSEDHLMPPSDPAVQREALQVEHRHRGEGVRGPAPAARLAGLGAGRRLRARLGRAPRRTAEPGVKLTHIGGPTVLIEAGGWRLLTDPTFDPPGRSYRFGWGTGSRKLAGPAIAAADLGPIDAVLLSHDHHDDNLDPAGRALLPSAGERHHHLRRRGAPRREHGRPRALADARPLGAGQDVDRDRGDAVPARAAGQPADRRRRDRLRPALGRPGARGRVDHRRHGALRRGQRRSRSGCGSARRCSTSAACASRSPGRCATR